MKLDKTTGPSGMSNEFIIAVWSTPDGKALLQHHLNSLLRAADLPTGFCDASLALLPKVTSVQKPGDYRPINLIETMHKLFSWLLISRLQPNWPVPKVQLGGMKGCQVCDALFSAQSRVTMESKQESYNIYLSCDISMAFDSLDQSSIAQFLMEECSKAQGHESLQLLRMLLDPRLAFYWQGRQWEQRQTAGIQQGGSRSAVLFSYILGKCIDRLEVRWRDLGQSHGHSTFSILFHS